MIGVSGADQLRRLAQALEDAGDKQLRRELYKAAQRATKPVKAEIKASALETLPHGGGLGGWVASLKIVTRTRLRGRNVGVVITGSRAVGERKADLRAINRGRVRHPVYGRWRNRDREDIGQIQLVRKGFWTRPLTGVTARRARREFGDAMDRIAREIKRRAA